MEPNETLTKIRRLMREIDDCDNDFRTADHGWGWWQDRCEDLVYEVAALDAWLRSGGAPPESWKPGADRASPLA